MAASRRALIATALELETAAVCSLLDGTEHFLEGPLAFVRGRLRLDPTWEVIVAEMGFGNTHSATVASFAVTTFRPDAAILVGICGGFAEEEVSVLDVIVPPDVHYYALGAAKDEFEHRPRSLTTSERLLAISRIVAAEERWKADLTEPDEGLRVRVEPLASGDHVLKSLGSDTYKLVRAISSKIVAVDMEASGFLQATRLRQPTETLVVRGVSDLISDKDPDRDAKHQPRAAAAAAAFAAHVLARLPDDADPPFSKSAGDENDLPVAAPEAEATRDPSAASRDLVVHIVSELDAWLATDRWHQNTEGVFWADPPKWWQSFDESLLQTIAFLRQRTPIPGAPEVDAALANLLHVLIDLRSVLQKDAEPMNHPESFWMRKYYRDAYGDESLDQTALGEQWQRECRLAKNLAAEATRAINLVHDRVRTGHELSFRVTEGLVGVFAGPDESFLPLQYSGVEAAADRPYPGLETFEELLPGRLEAFLPADQSSSPAEADSPGSTAAVPTRAQIGEEQSVRSDSLPRTDTGPVFAPASGAGAGAFNMHMPDGPLNTHLRNAGKLAVLVVASELETPLGSFEGSALLDDGESAKSDRPVRVAPGENLILQFGPGALASLPQNGGELTLVLRFTRADGGTQGEYRLQLLRAGGGVTQRPQWRPGGESLSF